MKLVGRYSSGKLCIQYVETPEQVEIIKKTYAAIGVTLEVVPDDAYPQMQVIIRRHAKQQRH